jgi:polygalacturonase
VQVAPGQATLPSDFSIATPTIPNHHFSIADFGAVGDGKTNNTAAITKAIKACTDAGGGTLEIPPGIFLTGPFQLAGSLNLHLDANATILLSDRREDFTRQGDGYENCITAQDCHDLEISGTGTIDGNGQSWWKEFLDYKSGKTTVAPPHRPYLLMITNCTRLLVHDVTLTNSPMLTFIPRLCHEVTIDSVHIKSPADSPNTDGIDPSGSNVLIQNCTIDTGDDNIALKPRPIPDHDHLSCENFLIQNCVFLHGHGMSIGGGSNGGVRNMIVRNCRFEDTDAGVRLKSGRGRGGLVENLTYENLAMKHVKTAIQIVSYYPEIPKHPETDTTQPVVAKTPMWRHIRINKLTAQDGANSIEIIGLPDMPVQDVVLKNVNITAQNPLRIINAQGIRFDNCQITATSGAPAEFYNSQVEGATSQP